MKLWWDKLSVSSVYSQLAYSMHMVSITSLMVRCSLDTVQGALELLWLSNSRGR